QGAGVRSGGAGRAGGGIVSAFAFGEQSGRNGRGAALVLRGNDAGAAPALSHPCRAAPAVRGAELRGDDALAVPVGGAGRPTRGLVAARCVRAVGRRGARAPGARAGEAHGGGRVPPHLQFSGRDPEVFPERRGRAGPTRSARSGSAAGGEQAWCRAQREAGGRVRHAKFGVGTVLRVEGEGELTKLTISFPGYGLKKLMQSVAALSPV